MFHLSLSSNLHLSIPLSDLPSPLLFHKQWTKSGQIKSPSSCYKLQTLIKQSVFFLNTTNKHQFPPSFLSFSLFPSLPLPFSRKHKTILSYPALAWENHKKNDKRPRKEAEKWCESESRAEVVKGESGQEGRRVRTRERETESARKGKERRKQVVLNKQNMANWVRCSIQNERKERNMTDGLWEQIWSVLLLISFWLGVFCQQ